MLRKLFGGKAKDEPGALAGESASAMPEQSDAAAAEASAASKPDRPWLAIGFSLADLDSAVRVRAFGESLVDRSARPETIFGEVGGCDDGLVTVLVHKKMMVEPAMEDEARRVMDELLAKVEPTLGAEDYIAIATEASDGAMLQLVASAWGDEVVVRENRVRDGAVEEHPAAASE